MNKITKNDNNKHPCIAIAVSGGVDSLYALIKLKEKYQNVIAMHGIFLNNANDKSKHTLEQLKQENHSLILDKKNKVQYEDNEIITGLALICEQFNIPLHIINLSHIFSNTVIQPFVKSYAKGRTPNPCIDCNINIKFGELWKYAQELKANCIATGHYASIYEHHIYGSCLQQGHDCTKDQSYFLSLVPLKTLKSAIFPLGNTLKNDAIAYLKRLGIQIPSPKESQDICFIPKELQQDYRTYIKEQARKYNIELGKSGNVILNDGKKLGQHQGLWNYTEGQRKGLGISWHEPLYVCHKDIDRNNLILGNKNQCLIQKCITEQANILVPTRLWPERLFARIRYRQSNLPAQVQIIDNALHIDFEQKQQLSAPDQVAAIYDTDNVLLAAARIIKCLH